MSRKQDKTQIEQLKRSLRATNRASDFRLLKLTVVMLILVVIASFIYGRIQI